MEEHSAKSFDISLTYFVLREGGKFISFKEEHLLNIFFMSVILLP
jgi:hypothetical protein